jgi:hypothetical protein
MKHFSIAALFLMIFGLFGCSPGGSTSSGTTSTSTAAPAISIISFDNASPLTGYVGQTTVFQFNVINQGSAAATLSGVSLSNTNSFSLTSTCGSTLAAAATCLVTLSFTPASTGNYSTTISVTDSASGSPQSLAVSVVADPPAAGQVSLSPAALTFANVIPNTASAQQTVTLANTGNTSLAVSSIAITGTNAASFVETNNCPASIVKGGLCTIAITLQPATASASFSGSLVVTDNAGGVAGSMQSVALSGNSTAAGAASQLVISPASLDFTGTPVGTAPTKTVTLTNHGTGTLTLGQLTPTGSGNYILETDTCGSTLAAGGSCVATVVFNATAMGTYTGVVTITDNALGSPQTIPITGTAVAAVISFSNTAVSFSGVSPNTTSTPQNITLTNSGNIPLTIRSIALAPNATPIFNETNTCGASLAAGSLCTLTFTFAPTAASKGYASYLNVSSNATPSTQTITLSGTSTGYAAQNALYLEPDSGFAWLYALVNSAASTIELTNYQFNDGTLLTDLENACTRGVRVRVLLNNASNNAATYAALNSAGANCSANYGSQVPVLGESALIIDDSQIAVMTLNLTSSTYSTARDFATVNNDPQDIAAAETTFNLDYSGATPAGYIPSIGSDLLWTPDTQSRLLHAISSAQYGVFIEAETIGSTAIMNQLLHDCTGAISDLTIILGPNNGTTLIDQFNTTCPGVIYISNKVHGTMVLIDQTNPGVASGTAFVGSMSLDDGSLMDERGLGIFVSGSNNILTLSNTFYTDLGTATQYQ